MFVFSSIISPFNLPLGLAGSLEVSKKVDCHQDYQINADPKCLNVLLWKSGQMYKHYAVCGSVITNMHS